MARIATLFILQAYAYATESIVSGTGGSQDFTDELADKFINKLVNKLFGITMAQSTNSFRAAVPLALPKPQFQMNALHALPNDAMRGNRRRKNTKGLGKGSRESVAASASPLASYSRPQFQNQAEAVSVGTMQDKLKSYGISSSPVQKLALTALAATRDVSMAAQVKEAFTNLDAKTKASVMAAEAAVESKASQLAGATAPMNFWDPWGLSTKSAEGDILFFREIELKHGRIAMLATLGIFAGETFSPLFGGPVDMPAAFAVQETTNVLFWPAVLLAVSNLEVNTVLTFGSMDRFSAEAKKQGWTLSDGRVPGDFGWDPLKLKPKDPKALVEMQNKELNNGRLAMFAAAGMIAQELVTGQKTFNF